MRRKTTEPPAGQPERRPPAEKNRPNRQNRPSRRSSPEQSRSSPERQGSPQENAAQGGGKPQAGFAAKLPPGGETPGANITRKCPFANAFVKKHGNPQCGNGTVKNGKKYRTAGCFCSLPFSFLAHLVRYIQPAAACQRMRGVHRSDSADHRPYFLRNLSTRPPCSTIRRLEPV